MVGTERRTNRQHKETQWCRTVLLGLLKASPLGQALSCLFYQAKHLLMHFCKLPCLTLGPADLCWLVAKSKSSMWTEARKAGRRSPGHVSESRRQRKAEGTRLSLPTSYTNSRRASYRTQNNGGNKSQWAWPWEFTHIPTPVSRGLELVSLFVREA